jgi:hypothetical protein
LVDRLSHDALAKQEKKTSSIAALNPAYCQSAISREALREFEKKFYTAADVTMPKSAYREAR